ncbi:MAG TPA: hypothetical protein VMV69_07345 [Pirellulales bacterium]|nr:hypothetical protein [Pirellulales bacterium]
MAFELREYTVVTALPGEVLGLPVALRNGSARSIRIIGAAEMCGSAGCNRVANLPLTIAPGSCATIHVEFHTRQQPGEGTNEIPFYLDHPDINLVKLRVRCIARESSEARAAAVIGGDVAARAQAAYSPMEAPAPPRARSGRTEGRAELGSVGRGAAAEGTMVIANKLAHEVRVAKVTTSCECLSVHLPFKTLAPNESTIAEFRLDMSKDPDFVGGLGIDVHGLDASGFELFYFEVMVDVKPN